MTKTNVMRLFDKAKIKYEALYYDIDESEFDGLKVSDLLGLSYDECFKTLALENNHNLYIMVIPVNKNIDLKKAAKATGEKSLKMLQVKELEKTIGYKRGSVSPVGIKAKHHLVFDESVNNHEMIEISGGLMGVGLKVNKDELITYLKADIKDIVRDSDD